MSKPVSSHSQGSISGKRVIFFLRTFGLGGAERQAALLANHLVEGGAEVAVWAYEKDGPLKAELDGRILTKSFYFGDELQSTRNWRLKAWSLFRIWLEILRFRPHAILPYTQIPSEDACYLAPWTGAKTVIWNQRDAGLLPTDRKMVRAAWRRCPLFVSNSLSGLMNMGWVIGRDIPVSYIPNGYIRKVPTKTPDEWRRELGISEGKDFVAVMVANLTRVKDHETVVRAWRLVVDRSRDGHRPVLLLAGLFVTTYDAIRDLVRELGLEDNVRLLGQVRDVTGLLGICDIGVFSSHTEGCPNGVLEPMAAGLPVVSTDIVGTREVLGDGNPGLVPFRDVEGFASVVLRLMGDVDERRELGKRNLARIEEKFSLNAMYSAYEELIIGGTRGRKFSHDPKVTTVLSGVTPKVTVLLPAYNAERYLREAMESVLLQSYPDFELLVINDGSTDRTAEVVRSFSDPRIHFVEHERNMGLIATLNEGLGLARGEYIARMDADDIALPERLARQVAYMETHPEVGICGTWFKFIGDAPPVVVKNPVEHDAIRCHLLFRNPIAHPSVMLRKALFDEHGLRYGQFKAAEDFELWQRCVGLFRVHNIPEVLLLYRVVSTSVTHANGGQLAESARRIFEISLDGLGLRLDIDGLRFHKLIGDETPFSRPEELERAAGHLTAILKANDSRLVYPQGALIEAVAYYWYSVCVRYQGFFSEALAAYVKSPRLGGRRLFGFAACFYLRAAKRLVGRVRAKARRLLRRG